MARRKNNSAIEGIFGIAAILPWWLGVVLAIAAYIFISGYAVMPEVDPLKPTGHLQETMIYNFAYFGQYIVPGLLLMGAVKSFYDRHKRKKLLSDVRGGATDPLNSISWREFEMLVGQFFREKGYKVHETAGVADGGVDLRLTANDFKTYLVQCKHWKASKVPVNIVRELYGVMVAEQAAGAYVVTSGQFTSDAEAFANGKNIVLVDGRYLVSAIKNTTPTNPQQPELTTVPAAVSCPICNSDMVLRTARKGVNAGNQFYGCSEYPRCRGTRAL